MVVIYDCIIIGAGPAGLTFATLADKNENILLIDKDDVIGGCHKVNRQKYENEYYFCEHGPRVYFNNYVNLMMILNTIGLKFNQIFKKFNLTFIEILNEINKNNYFSIREIFIIIKDFMTLMINSNYKKNVSMKNYMDDNNFTDKAKNYIDRMCRLMDGGDSSKISFHTYFNIISETVLYNIYQPSKPLDESLFFLWKKYLKKRNITFKLKTGLKRIIENTENITKIETDNNEILQTKKLILALPPENLIKILSKSSDNIKNSFINFKSLKTYSKNTEYNEYISISFHWNFKVDINTKLYGMYSNTEWGIGAIVLSDYMKFKESQSITVISCAITITDVKSKTINKTANECNDKNELINEVFRQLKNIYNHLPIPTLAFINNNYLNNEWKSNETAFIKTSNYDYIKPHNNKNIYTLGTHNGYAKVHFTSMESAVSNAIKLVNIIYNKNYNIKRPYNLRDLLIIIIIFLIVIVIVNLYIFK